MAATSSTTRTGIFIFDFLSEKGLVAPGGRIKLRCGRLAKSFVEVELRIRKYRMRRSCHVCLFRVLGSGRDGRDDEFAEQTDTHAHLGLAFIARGVFIVSGFIRGRRIIIRLFGGGQVLMGR